MITTNDIEKLNSELLNIWSTYNEKIKNKDGKVVSPLLSPCYLSDTLVTNECKLLVLGLNPSYSYPNWKKVLKKEIPPEQDITQKLRDLRKKILDHSIVADKKNKSIDNYCKFRDNDIQKNDLIYLDSSASDKSEGVQYFSKIRELAEEILMLEKSNWRHLDIFYYRETKQNKIKNLIDYNDDFFSRQMDITKRLILMLEPSMILVSNAFAGENFRKMFADDSANFFVKYPINLSQGTHLIQVGKKKNVPLFFSGMLSGQRALDLGSYERLKWHMKAVADGKSMKK